MADIFDTPLGTDGFEFVEFAVPPGHAEAMHRYLCSMGFSATRRHRARAITLYRQGGVNFLLNEAPDPFASDFAAGFGHSVNITSFSRQTAYLRQSIDASVEN